MRIKLFDGLKNLIYGYESNFNGKIISKGVMTSGGRKNDKIEKRN